MLNDAQSVGPLYQMPKTFIQRTQIQLKHCTYDSGLQLAWWRVHAMSIGDPITSTKMRVDNCIKTREWSDVKCKYNLFKCHFRDMVLGRPFVHCLLDSLGHIHQGLDGHYVKNHKNTLKEANSTFVEENFEVQDHHHNEAPLSLLCDRAYLPIQSLLYLIWTAMAR